MKKYNPMTMMMEEAKPLTTDRKMKDFEGTKCFFVRYHQNYEHGGDMDPFVGTAVVKANTSSDAIRKAKAAIPRGYNFEIDGNRGNISFEAWKSKYPNANYKIIDSKPTKDAYNDFIVKARLEAEKVEKEYYQKAKGKDRSERFNLAKEYRRILSNLNSSMDTMLNKLSEESYKAKEYINKIDEDIVKIIYKD